MQIDDIEAGFAAGARLLVFSHPCNPTGTVYGRPFITALAALAVRYDAYVLVDELYSRLVHDDDFAHLAAEPGMRERCITTLGTSKTESMSGFRVGALVGPPELLPAVADVLEVSALRASSYAQYALADWLGPDDDWIQERVARMRSQRDLTVEILSEVDGLDLSAPGGTGYVFPRFVVPPADDFVVAETLVHRAGVLVFPGLLFGANGIGGFRLCYAQDERLPDVLQRVAATLTGLVRG